MSFKALFYIEQNYSYAVLRPLQAEILRHGGEVRWLLVGGEVNANYLLDGERVLANAAEARNWQPQVVFVPGNTVSRVIPGLKVAVFHGFRAGKINRRGAEGHFVMRGCFDLYCTHGPSTTQRFKALQKQYGYFDVVETGWPMVDPLFQPVRNNPYIDNSDTRKTLLFCSTFSRKYSSAEQLYDEVKLLKLKGKWRWLLQFHPKMPQATVNKFKALQDENLTFIETDNVIPLLQAADAMLCDTSSILLMFLLLNKPVVTFNNQNPGEHLIDIQEPDLLEAALEQALTPDAVRFKAIRDYCLQMNPYSDGRSSARIVSAVEQTLQSGTQLARKKPLNLIREIKERKKLRYWWPA
jgi:hypothetical protein